MIRRALLVVAGALLVLMAGCSDDERPMHDDLNGWVEEASRIPGQEDLDETAAAEIEPQDADREYKKLRAEILGESADR